MTTTLADLTEKEWQAQALELLGLLGWSHYFTYRSKRSPAGYPDLTCWRERVLFLELKRETGRLSAEQKRVIMGLMNASAEVYVVRPSDLETLGKVLAARWRVTGDLTEQTRREVNPDPPPQVLR